MQKGQIRREELAFEKNFTQIPNTWLRDDRLSLRARGLLAVLMSHKEGWRVTVADLSTKKPDGSTREGAHATLVAVRELEAFGYLFRESSRDSRGRVAASDWVIQDPANATVDLPESSMLD